jgi:hypothetical protein
MADQGDRWLRLTLARADGSAGDDVIVKAALIGLVGPLTDENAQRFPRGKCALTLLQGGNLILEESTQELHSQLSGGH